jgi:uncharacterized protein GlcG (DUF336 family)
MIMKSLTLDDLQEMMAFLVALSKELEIELSAYATDKGRIISAGFRTAGARQMTENVAFNKAIQSVLTGARTGKINKEDALLFGVDPTRFVPFLGGAPIYDKFGNHLGGLGVSEQKDVSDLDLAIAAIEAFDFKSDRPRGSDIDPDKIRLAAAKVKVKVSKKK